ncbi:MAG: CBS domain-containing protein [Clostridia bacterium]|nr:CBS domain-containing protein [Clostridia bacterium]
MNIIQFLIPKSATVYLTEDSTVRNGLEKMAFHGYRAIPVITSRGKYAGTVTEGDFLRCVIGHGADLRELEQIKIKDIIDREFNPEQRIDVPMRDLFARVTEQNFVPVVDDRGSFIGIVTRRKVMRHLCAVCFEPDPEPAK